MIPKELIQSLQQAKDFDEQAFVAVHSSKEQITSIRYNPLKLIDDRELFIANELETLNFKPQTSKVPWCNYGFYLEQRPFFTHDPLIHCGAYYVQEASSMFLWQVLQQHIGSNTQKTVLDLCAAPGGKSTLLASFFTNGFIVSNEVIKQRAAVLVENITKWGANNIVVTNNDPKDFKHLINFFDVIVVDAPCSGSGLFRKDATAINEWSVDNVNLCSQRQQRITNDIIDALNNNDGIFIYSTCSYSKQENEDIVDWIIATYQLTSLQINIDESWGIIETKSDAQNGFGYRFYPNKVKGEGFFIAAFKKENSESKQIKLKETQLQKLLKQEEEIINSYIVDSNSFSFFKHNDAIKLFPKNWLQQLQIVASYLYIKKAGIEVGAIKHKDLIPAHELAMSHLALNKTQTFNLNKKDAQQYLSKKEVIIDTNYIGWALLLYKNVSLGWAKILPNRMNNYYPTEWRILKTNFEDE